jgi:hypothetical protein
MKHLKHTLLAQCHLSGWTLIVVELTDAEVGGGACSSAVRQRSGEYCMTLGEHMIGGLGARPQHP